MVFIVLLQWILYWGPIRKYEILVLIATQFFRFSMTSDDFQCQNLLTDYGVNNILLQKTGDNFFLLNQYRNVNIFKIHFLYHEEILIDVAA